MPEATPAEETPYEAPMETPYETPMEAPNETPLEIPYETPEYPPQSTPTPAEPFPPAITPINTPFAPTASQPPTFQGAAGRVEVTKMAGVIVAVAWVVVLRHIL